MAKIDCKSIVEKVQQEIRDDASIFFRKPKLATILVGERADSQTYVRNKEKTLEKVGFEYVTFRYPEDVSQETLEFKLLELGIDNDIDGILIQLPLPKHLDADKLLSMIPFYKDVDGLTAPNQAKLFMGEKWDNFIQPCTPLGIVKILEEEFTTSLDSFSVAVIGRSNLLGNPLAQMLMRKNCTVTHLHSKSLMRQTLKMVQPDVICLCTGQKNLLSAYDIASLRLNGLTSTIIDAGIMRDENGLRGDFRKEDYDILDDIGIDYTSVPGGVGVLTTTMLAYNLAKCFKLHMSNLTDL